jgi:hypothetical protein
MPEPKVKGADVCRILEDYILRYDHMPRGEVVEILAFRAGISTRTIYRILQGSRPWLDLGQADSLLVAADAHLNDVEVK